MLRNAKSEQVSLLQFVQGNKRQHLRYITIGFILGAILLTLFYSSVMSSSNFVPSLKSFSRKDFDKSVQSAKDNSDTEIVNKNVNKPNQDSAKTINEKNAEKAKEEAKAKEEYIKKINTGKECYKLKKSIGNVIFFDDIEKTPPKLDRSIFFIDTTCYDDPRVQMNSRKACAIESAAKQNPNRDVYILFVARMGFVSDEADSSAIAVVKSYPNVHFRNVDIYNYSRGTPAEAWIKEDRIFSSPNYRFHLSDYLRLISLYKFGGIYFDTDFLIVQNFDRLPPNFAPQERPDAEYINNSVLGFESTGFGHKFVERILRECFEKYNPNHWDFNGPWAVWRATTAICNVTKMAEMVRPNFCSSYKVMPNTAFFPLRWFTEAFDTNSTIVQNSLKKITSETVAIHLWSSNSLNVGIKKSDGPNMYTILAEKFCQKAYTTSGLYFN